MMQQQPQTVTTQVVCPKPTDAQITAQIESMHWQQHEADLQNSWQRQQSSTQQRVDHEHYMVDHLATPLVTVSGLAIVAATLLYLIRRAIDADVQKHREDNAADIQNNKDTQAAKTQRNKDDNAAEVLRAQEIIEKHEEGS